jgi:hypothetical protein
MIREKFELTLPYQAPQIVDVRRWGPGHSRISVVDRFNRFFWLNGEDVGFNVTVYRSSTSSPRVRLVIYGDYEAAIWTELDGKISEVNIRRLTI